MNTTTDNSQTKTKQKQQDTDQPINAPATGKKTTGQPGGGISSTTSQPPIGGDSASSTSGLPPPQAQAGGMSQHSEGSSSSSGDTNPSQNKEKPVINREGLAQHAEMGYFNSVLPNVSLPTRQSIRYSLANTLPTATYEMLGSGGWSLTGEAGLNDRPGIKLTLSASELDIFERTRAELEKRSIEQFVKGSKEVFRTRGKQTGYPAAKLLSKALNVLRTTVSEGYGTGIGQIGYQLLRMSIGEHKGAGIRLEKGTYKLTFTTETFAESWDDEVGVGSMWGSSSYAVRSKNYHYDADLKPLQFDTVTDGRYKRVIAAHLAYAVAHGFGISKNIHVYTVDERLDGAVLTMDVIDSPTTPDFDLTSFTLVSEKLDTAIAKALEAATDADEENDDDGEPGAEDDDDELSEEILILSQFIAGITNDIRSLDRSDVCRASQRLYRAWETHHEGTGVVEDAWLRLSFTASAPLYSRGLCGSGPNRSGIGRDIRRSLAYKSFDDESYTMDIAGDRSASYGSSSGTASIRGTDSSTSSGENKTNSSGAGFVDSPFRQADGKWTPGVLFRINSKDADWVSSSLGIFRHAPEILNMTFSSPSPLVEWALSKNLIERYPLHFTRRYLAGERFPIVFNALCTSLSMQHDRVAAIEGWDFKSTIVGTTGGVDKFEPIARQMQQMSSMASNNLNTLYKDIGLRFEWNWDEKTRRDFPAGIRWRDFLTAERYPPWFFERVFDTPYGAGVPSSNLVPEILDNVDAEDSMRYAQLSAGAAYQAEGVVRNTWLKAHVLEEDGSLKTLNVLRTPHLSSEHINNRTTLCTVGTAPHRSVFRFTSKRVVYSTYLDDPHPRELTSVQSVVHPRDLFDPRGQTILDNVDTLASGALGALFRV